MLQRPARLVDEAARRDILALTGSDDSYSGFLLQPSVVLFRCFQRAFPPIKDRAHLEGLREIVSACASNDIAALLPNSGWVGWLAQGWGAHAYSGGAAQSSWYDRNPTPMSSKPPTHHNTKTNYNHTNPG